MVRRIALLFATALVLAPAAVAEGETAAEPSVLAADGAWCWFADPRAIHRDGRTYYGWVSGTGDIAVASYDHSSGNVASATLAPSFEVDDHDNPALYMRRDGRLVVYWSAHAGPKMYWRVSTRPGDVTEWGPRRSLPTNTPGTWGYTYPNPVRLRDEDNRLYLFWRGGNFKPSFSTSEDDGETWATARTLINQPDQRPYVKYAEDGGDTIHFAFTQGHPSNVHANIHYAAYRDGRLWRADGSEIADVETELPITPAQADMVYDATGRNEGWIHDVAVDDEGRPVIVYATFPADQTEHAYRYARWNGSAWVDNEFTPAGGTFVAERETRYSGGVALNPEDPSVAWVSREFGDHHEIERWRTPDGGASWWSTTVTADSSADNVRPFVPRGLPPERDAEAMWMRGEYRWWTDYSTALVGTPTLVGAGEDGTGAPALGGPAATPPAPPPPAAPPPGPLPSEDRSVEPSRTTLRISRRRLKGQRVRVRGRLVTRDGAPVAAAPLMLVVRTATRRVRTPLRTDAAGRVAVTRRFRRRATVRLTYAGTALHAGARSRRVVVGGR